MIRNKSKVFLAGPPLVKAAIGEEVSDEELGGADLHATVSGTAEYLAENDEQGIQMARDILAALPWPTIDEQEQSYKEPLYPLNDLLGLISSDPKKPFDAKDIIARLVDGSEFLEFKALFGPQTICGHASIQGIKCGIISNNGPIYPEGSVKAAQFIQLCSQVGLPLIFLHNTTGYMVGSEAERQGAIKHGSKMIQAVANAPVPKISLVIGGSYGAGNYGMCGRAYDPRFCFAWPNSRVSVMGGEQAAKVMEIITEQKFEKMGQKAEPEVLKMLGDKIKSQFDAESTALYASARLWDDGIIDPRDSRKILGECLAICATSKEQKLNGCTFGVARL